MSSLPRSRRDASVEAGGTTYELTLFVVGASPISASAIVNARELCDEHLQGSARLEIVDIRRHPGLAVRHHVTAAPTLVRTRPPPSRQVIGDLARTRQVLAALELAVPVRSRVQDV